MSSKKTLLGLGIRLLNGLLILSLLIPNAVGKSYQENGQSTINEGINTSANVVHTQNRPTVDHPELRIGQRLPAKSNLNNKLVGQSPPFLYVENIGQFDDQARFKLLGTQEDVYFTGSNIWITLIEPSPLDSLQTKRDRLDARDEAGVKGRFIKGINLKVSFVGSNPNPEIVGIDPLDSTISYFIGKGPEDWYTNVPVFGGIRYKNLYDNIDLELSYLDNRWMWKIIVNEALTRREQLLKLQQVQLKIEGANAISTDEGNIRIQTNLGGYSLPLLELSGQTRSLGFTADEIGMVEFSDAEIANPFNTSNLVADNAIQLESSSNFTHDLIYSTFLGGSVGGPYTDRSTARDWIGDIASDIYGNVFVAGSTESADFPVTPGGFLTEFDPSVNSRAVFITKLNSDGNYLIYSTFIAAGSYPAAAGLDIDQYGSAYITGWAEGGFFPTTPGALKTSPCDIYDSEDAFLTVLSPGGNYLEYSTLLGGCDDEYGTDVKVGPDGEAYVVGGTNSSDFPVTSGAYQTYFSDVAGGVFDVFVTKILPQSGALAYSTYLGGIGDDFGNVIDVDRAGSVYISGDTKSDDFPVAGPAYQAYLNGSSDVFIAKFDESLSNLLYSSFLGGDDYESSSGLSLVEDAPDIVYLAGQTQSSNFPTTPGAFQTNYRLNNDAFVTKLDLNSGELIYSTYLGGSYYDFSSDIAVGKDGSVFIGGGTLSSNFPVTPNALQSTSHVDMITGDGFITHLNPDGSGLIYSSYIGGSGDDDVSAVDLDPGGILYVSGATQSVDFPITPGAFQTVLAGGPGCDPYPCDDSFVMKFGSILAEKSSLSSCTGEDCIATYDSSQAYDGKSINTRTGSYEYSTEDLSFVTTAGTVSFKRTYSSAASDIYDTPLGYGWTHNHDLRLIFPTDPGGEPGAILFKGHNSNQYTFVDNGDGTYSPSSGLLASLTRDTTPLVMYTLTNSVQEQYIFDETGRLISYRDPNGNFIQYSYNNSNLLSKVSDSTGTRYLSFSYTKGKPKRIASIVDHAGRQIAFSYDKGNLVSMTDVSGQTWTYRYDDSDHPKFITEVIDPRGITVERTEYDTLGRAVRQYNGNGNLIVELVYNPDGTTTVIDALGNDETYTFDRRNTLTNYTDQFGNSRSKTYDSNFRLTSITDPIGNSTNLSWSVGGLNLLRITDAAGGQTDMGYDSLNNLTAMVDAQGITTTYAYSGSLLLNSTDGLGHTTTYTYTTAADAPQPPGLLKAVIDPLGNTTTYTYDQFGQRVAATDALMRTTTYAYDDLGRLLTVTDPLGRSNWTCYDLAGRVVRTVTNASGDGSSPQTDPCDTANYVASANPDQDRITTTVYDHAGNVIATIDPSGRITRTYYDNNNRPVTVVQNLVGQAIEVDTPPARNAANVDENIRSDTVYDVVGNVIAAIDPLGVVTRTYYDANRRPVTVVQNLVGQTIEVSTPPGRNPAVPDENLRTDMVYDELGNPIATIDPLGLITRTYYDGLSRSVTVVQNLVGQAIEAGTPPARDPANPDQNVRTDSVYDASGQAIAKVDPLGKITRAYFDNLSRPVSTVQNLVGQAIEVDTPRRGIQPIPIRTPAPIRPTTWLAIRLRLSTPWARSRAPTTMDSTAR